MRKFVTALTLTLAFVTSLAWALSPPISTITINGHTYTDSQWTANPQGTLAALVADIVAITSSAGINGVSTNVALKNLTAGQYSYMVRHGFVAVGDGGYAVYRWSSSACSLNAGAGDDGSQVAPNSGVGCWIAQLGPKVSAKLWGAKLDGSTDDTSALQNAGLWSSATKGTVILDGIGVVSCAAQFYIDDGLEFEGTNRRTTGLKLCPSAAAGRDLAQTRGLTTVLPQGASSSSVAIGTGSKSFTVGSGLGFVVGQPIEAVDTTSPANWMSGTVASYSGTTLTMTVPSGRTGGSGTPSAWYIRQTGNTTVSAGTNTTGPTKYTLRNLTLDGNAANNTALLYPFGRVLASYAQGVALDHVDIINARGNCWEQAQAISWVTAANNADGITRATSSLFQRCNQRQAPDVAGGIGGGGIFYNGPTDARFIQPLIGWNEGGYGLKVGPYGNLRMLGGEIFDGGYPGYGGVYSAKYGVISECITGQCYSADNVNFGMTNVGGGYQILARTNDLRINGGFWYLVVGAPSTTSVTIGTGTKTFTVSPGLGIAATQYVKAYQTSSPGNYMSGTVTSYDPVTGVLITNITESGGSGTIADWTIGPSFRAGGIQIGDVAHGYTNVSGVRIESPHLIDIYGPNVKWDSSGGFNKVALSGYTNWAEPNNAGLGTVGVSDEFDIRIAGNAAILSSNARIMMLMGGTSQPTLMSAGNTYYLGPAGYDGNNSSSGSAFFPISPGVITGFNVFAGAAPGAGKSITFTVMKNAVAQSCAGILSDTSQTLNVTGCNVPINGTSDVISLRAEVGAAAASTNVGYALRQEY